MTNILDSGAGVLVADSVTALAFPPTTFGYITDWDQPSGDVPEFDLEMWAVSSNAVTAAELFGAVGHPLVVTDITVTGSASANTLTHNAHGLLNGDGPIQLSNSGGALPGGLSASTNYWAVKNDANSIKVATTRANALAGTTIDLTTDGTGTTTLSDTADTQRIWWHSHGLLGHAADGAITLGAQQGYTIRCDHRPGVFAYAVSATFGSAVATSIRVYPVRGA